MSKKVIPAAEYESMMAKEKSQLFDLLVDNFNELLRTSAPLQSNMIQFHITKFTKDEAAISEFTKHLKEQGYFLKYQSVTGYIVASTTKPEFTKKEKQNGDKKSPS